MISRRAFEQKNIQSYVFLIFRGLDDWIEHIKATNVPTEWGDNRAWLAKFFEYGYATRMLDLGYSIVDAVNQLDGLIVLDRQDGGEGQVCLNDLVTESIQKSKSLFETMGTQVLFPASPKVLVRCTRLAVEELLHYLAWWLIDAWPDGQITVRCGMDEGTARVSFEYLEGIHTDRVHTPGYLIAEVWYARIDYIATVTLHGRCLWPNPRPKEGEPCRLEIILPLCPPTDQELDEPLPAWMQ